MCESHRGTDALDNQLRARWKAAEARAERLAGKLEKIAAICSRDTISSQRTEKVKAALMQIAELAREEGE